MPAEPSRRVSSIIENLRNRDAKLAQKPRLGASGLGSLHMASFLPAAMQLSAASVASALPRSLWQLISHSAASSA
jgi:hypothetical protein